MHIAYIHKSHPANYVGGDAIYDRKLSAAIIALGHDVTTFALEQSPLLPSAARAAVYGTTIAAGRFNNKTNRLACDRIKQCAPDAVIVSHEALIEVVTGFNLAIPVLFILHNLMSAAVGRIGIHALMRERSLRTEERAFSRRNYGVAVLSYRELLAITPKDRQRVALMPPGLGRVASSTPLTLDDEGVFLNGSTDWGLKARDYSFLKRETPASINIHEDGLMDDDSRLRIGIVADRFLAGFKLKVSDYIANNCAIIALSDVSSDFHPKVAPQYCVKVINTPQEIPLAMEAIRKDFHRVSNDINRLKNLWRAEITWEASARTAISAIHKIESIR